ncbi:MAG: AAA family ATPase [Erysipelotrichaceae bacterium]|nr:AAA family ATPase [Erysipelotrichaceae bacterium]
MLFLERFSFPSYGSEEGYINEIRRTTYITYYPFRVLSKRHLENVTFDQITIFYGDNGSGKSTALNVIAEKIKADRFSSYNKTSFFEPYLSMCNYEMPRFPREKLVITSDAVFEYLFNTRAINDGVDIRRVELADEYQRLKDVKAIEYSSIGDYENLRKLLEQRRSTESSYFRKNSMMNVPEESNGESALRYFESKINEAGIYLLDEPENSLSPENQLKLKQFIEDSARFYSCQFIIATHSPFLLSLDHAKIYDLDSDPCRTRRWTQLDNIVTYHDFFRDHFSDFEQIEDFEEEYGNGDPHLYGKQDRLIQEMMKEKGIDDEFFFEYLSKKLYDGDEKAYLRRWLNDKDDYEKKDVFEVIEYIVKRRGEEDE